MLRYSKTLTVLLCLLVYSASYSQSQPTFNSGQDPKPAGKKWQKVENMSDEFNGSSLDTNKWADQDPQWEGRMPTRFEKSSVSVSGGNLKIVGSKKTNPSNGWTHNGGLVRSLNKAKYGYYETKMKANKTCLSSTFWLINKRNESPTSSCDFRVTELDVTENVGIDAYPNLPNRNWVNQNIRSINSNTHSRKAPNAQQCGTNIDIIGDKTPIGEEAWRDYHVYGVWWKSATEMIFFIDGREAHRVTPAANFNLDMYLRMVVESYTWNNPRDGFDNMNLSQAERTTSYDWTRSWQLVDDNNPPAGGDDTVNCTSLPSSVQTSTAITVPVAYSADQNRDVVLELWNTSNNSYINAGKTTVSAGSGTTNVTINLATTLAAGTNYQFKASIRPVGASWQQNIDACNKTGISLTSGGNPGGPPDVDCASLPSSLQSSTSIVVPVDYTSDQNRDVVIELWNTSSNSYIDSGKTTVTAGSGTANVTIDLVSAPASGSNYQLKASIRPVGASWQQNIDACNKSNITLTGGAANNVSCDLPWSSSNQSITQQTENWTSSAIDISCASSVNISMLIDGLTPQKMESSDYLNIFYQVDGGNQVPISQNTDGFAAKTINANNVSGSSLILIVNGKTSWTDETYTIKNISVIAANSSTAKGNTNSRTDILLNSMQIDKLDEKSQFSVYPNPVGTDGIFNLSLGNLNEEKSVVIYDLSGRTLLRKNTSESQLILNRSDLQTSSGIYLIVLERKGRENEVFKLIAN